MPLLSVIFITYNEEIHLGRAIRSLDGLDCAVFVVDSFSSDSTVQIAQGLGASVLQNTFVSHSSQFQWALDNLPIESPWILRLDADELLSSELVSEISERLPNLHDSVSGVILNRRHIFMNRWIRFGGRYPVSLLRLWRTGFGVVEDKWMDEHIVVRSGAVVRFKHDFSDWNLNDITYFIHKHNRYATLEAVEVLVQSISDSSKSARVSFASASFSTALKRWLKTRIYNSLPLGVGSLLYFLYRYLLQLGFLDGKPGLIYHFLQGFWYRFLVSAKIYELRQSIRGVHDRQEAVRAILRSANLRAPRQ